MKKVLILFLPLVMILLASMIIVTRSVGNDNNTTLWKANLEALSKDEAPYCHSGGPGAKDCSITAGTNIAGIGISGGCSVSCGGNTYACCSLRCTCVSYIGV